MDNIKTIADQLREKLNQERLTKTQKETKESTSKDKTIKIIKKNNSSNQSNFNDEFFKRISDYNLNGSDKILIRLDNKTMTTLKRLKLLNGIDMNKFIVFGLQAFLDQNSWLPEYINEKLKNTEL